MLPFGTNVVGFWGKDLNTMIISKTNSYGDAWTNNFDSRPAHMQGAGEWCGKTVEMVVNSGLLSNMTTKYVLRIYRLREFVQ